MGFGIRVRCALEGKHTNKSAEGGPLPSLPFMVYTLVPSLVQILCLRKCECIIF